MVLRKLTVAAALLVLFQSSTAAQLFQQQSPDILSRFTGNLAQRDDTNPLLLYPEYNFSTPIDHFHNDSKYEPHSDGKFNMRYWFDATFYKKGGPVIVLAAGETSGEDRLTFLQKGIVYKLAKATNGIGVILEHRYYGNSFPTPDLSVKNLRFLTTDQALADTAYFASNVVFTGLEHLDLTASTTPWVAYGGSYAGAFVAFLRVLYPDVFWGAISSSGVTKAIWDYWEYYEPIRIYGPPDCIQTQQKLTHAVDNILIGHNDSIPALKAVFQLSNVTHNKDFANVLSNGPSGWQGRNWDPAVGDDSFFVYCDTIANDTLVYPTTSSLTSEVKDLLDVGGYGDQPALVTRMLNYIGYLNDTYIAPCAKAGTSQDQCFSNYNLTYYQQDSLDQSSWRSWPYQYCTEWGYLQTGSGVPATTLPLISRTLDLEYFSLVCKYAFNITTPPDVEIINKHGGFDISYPRLAIIDGEQDPWRPATPHAEAAKPWPRANTASEPFMMIAGAVHHWDENGLFPNETTPSLPPLPVRDVQDLEVQFVQEWMLEAQLKWGR